MREPTNIIALYLQPIPVRTFVAAILLLAVAAMPAAAHAETVLEADGRTYALAGDGPIRVMDVTLPHTPLKVAEISGFEAADMQISYIDGRPYLLAVSSENSTLHVVDIAEPYWPATVSVLPGTAGELAVSDIEVIQTGGGSYALLTAGDTVQIVDVTDPKAPAPVGEIRDGVWSFFALEEGQEIEQFSIGDRTYVLVSSVDAVQVADFTDPLDPSAKSVIRHGQYGFEAITDLVDIEILVTGESALALIAGTDAVQVADLSDPSAPAPITVMEYGFAGITDMDILAADGRSYALILDSQRIHVVDIADPASPLYLSGTDLFDANSFDGISGVSSDGRLWVMLAGKTMFMLDVTNPQSPIPAYVRDGTGLYDPVGMDTVTIDGRLYAMVANFAANAIEIVDITDPSSPTPVAGITGGQYGYGEFYGPNDVEIAEIGGSTYALIPNIRSNTVAILDVTEPAKPALVSSVGDLETLFAPAHIVAVEMGQSTYAVVSSHYENGIQIIDITDPHVPEPVISMHDDQYGFDALTGTLRIDTASIDGSTYILSTGYYDEALQITDITDILSPVPAASIFDGQDGYEIGGIQDVQTARIGDGTYAVVVGSYDDTVTVIDISDPYSPVMASQLQNDQGGIVHMVGSKSLDVAAIAGSTYALVTSEPGNSVQIIDISDPASPVAVSAMVNGPNTFEDLSGPVDVSVVSTEGRAYAVVINTFGDSMQIVDITNPSSPISVSALVSGPDSVWQLFGPEGVESVTADGRTYALSSVYSQDVIRVTEITDPTRPVPVYTIRDGHDGFEVAGPAAIDVGAIDGRQYALVAGFRDSVIQVVDVSDPARPVPVSVIRDGEGSFDRLASPVDVELVKISDVWYAVTASPFDNTFHVIYMNDPTAPFSIATVGHGENGFELIGAEDVDTVKIGSRTFAVVSSFGDSSVQIIDITNPVDPRPASIIRGGEGGYDLLYSVTDSDTIKVGEQTLLVAVGYRMDAVIIVDISDPYNPVRLSSLQGHETGTYMNAVESVHTVLIGDGAYVVASSKKDSFQIIDITDPESPVGLSVTGTGLGGTTIYGVIDVDVVQTDSYTLVLSLMRDGINSPIVDISDPSSPVNVADIPPAYVAIAPE